MRFMLLSVLLLSCGLPSTASELLSPDTIVTAAELRAKWGEPCTVEPAGDSEVWTYCVHIGADGRELWAVCRPECPQRHEMTIRAGLVVKHETVGAPLNVSP